MTTAERNRLHRLSDPILHDRLKFKESTIRKLVHLGQLRAVKVRGILLVPDSEVDRFIDAVKDGDLG